MTGQAADALARRAADLGVIAGGGPLQIIPGSASGRLSGWRIGLKDNIAVAGSICAAGIPGRAGHVALHDAHVVACLRRAGADLVPRLVMDEAGLGAAGDNAAFGCPENPRWPGHATGGSSSGSAAAVAAGLVTAALGTDTLGSVRIPAAWCGVIGLKPTAGLIGCTGVQALAPTLDTVGLLARDLDRLAALLPVLQVRDRHDPGWTGPPSAKPRGRPDGEGSERRLRIGIWPGPEARAVADALAQAGHVARRIGRAPTCLTDLRRAAFLLTEAEAASVWAGEIDRSGYFSPACARLLRFGRDMGSARLADALAQFAAARAVWARLLRSFDLLVTPTVADPPVVRGSAVPDTIADFTAPANVLGIPALALPVPQRQAGPPVSVQILGPAFSETRLIAVARLLTRPSVR